MLALAHSALGDVDEAVKIFKEWLGEEPENPIAMHMLAACTGQGHSGTRIRPFRPSSIRQLCREFRVQAGAVDAIELHH